MDRGLTPWADYIEGWLDTVRLQPAPRCGTLTHDNHDVALLRHPQASDGSGEVTWTAGGTAIIRGEKADLEPNEGDST